MLRRMHADITGDEWLADLATSDVLWDEIVAIQPLGPQPVFDATIDGTQNFVANGIVAHNSLEQDADVVMFLYRDEVYNSESPDKGAAEVIIAKHSLGVARPGWALLTFLVAASVAGVTWLITRPEAKPDP